MRKIWTLAGILLMMTLSGCKKEPCIGVCLRNPDEGVSGLLAEQLEERLEAKGFSVEVESAHEDQSAQNQQILTFFKEKVDLLIVEPVITQQMEDVAELAASREIPLICLNHTLPETVTDRWKKSCCIDTQTDLLARLQWELASNGDRNGDGALSYSLLGGDKAYLPATKWEDSWKQMDVPAPLHQDTGPWSVESGRRMAARQLKTFGNRLEVVFCAGEELTLGAMDAISDSGESVCLVGIGGSAEVLEGIRQGRIWGTVCMDPNAIAAEAAKAAEAFLGNEEVSKVVLVPPVSVGKEKLESFKK